LPGNKTLDALPDGTQLQNDQFTVLRRIGNGGFGITYLAQDNYLDRQVVIKECFPHAICCRQNKDVVIRWEIDRDKLRRIIHMFVQEGRKIAKLQHPNINRIQRIFEENFTAYIVLELVEGPTLLEVIKGSGQYNISPQEITNILFKLLDAVQAVHAQDFLHRDIAPDNILLNKWGAPILIDFGASREEASRESRELSVMMVVKDGYSPQEFYYSGGKQGRSSDLYALAATFYHLIAGEVPPNSQLRATDIACGSSDPCIALSGRFTDYDERVLQSIDKAMQVLPQNRFQSALQWSAIIRQNQQVTTQSMSTMDKSALIHTIQKVVSEIKDDIVFPEVTEPSEPVTPTLSRLINTPDWVDEFNAETKDRNQKTTASTVSNKIIISSITCWSCLSKLCNRLFKKRAFELMALSIFASTAFLAAK
jgi:serine/threonine protein kinase